MNSEKLLACNNEKCMKKEDCERYRLFKIGATEFSTNGGNEEKGCKKFVQRD